MKYEKNEYPKILFRFDLYFDDNALYLLKLSRKYRSFTILFITTEQN